MVTSDDEMRMLCCPFHNGLRNVGMGNGASRLALDEPLRRGIEAEGWTLSCEEIAGVDESRPEIARVIELIRGLAVRVRAAVDDGAFPPVLAGNCNSSLGTAAGIGAKETGAGSTRTPISTTPTRTCLASST